MNVFNPAYERTVSIAYRLAQSKQSTKQDNLKRNHYDTVVKIEDKIISECAEGLIEQLQRKIAINNNNNNSIISIDDED